MKPVKLTIQAFGSYKNKVEIDFSMIEAHQLFVISGPTGAGKTTIFDAICFALYGSASGSDRENNEMLRSNYAADDVHTRVDFTFALKGKTYYIFRQLGHIRQGNKTKTGDKYGFYELKGEQQIPCVERQIVSAIDDRVVELIGLTEKQFKQIVMLPQGEFRKLLISETKNKEEILRSLFETKKYETLNQILGEKRKEKTREFEQFEMRLSQTYEDLKVLLEAQPEFETIQVLNREHFLMKDVEIALNQDVEMVEKSLKTHAEKLEKARQNRQQKELVFQEKKQTNQQFEQLNMHVKKLEALKAEEETWQAKKDQLTLAEKIKIVRPYQENMHLTLTKLENMKKSAKETQGQFETAKTVLAKTEQSYAVLRAEEDKRDQLKIEINAQEKWLPLVNNVTQTLSKVTLAKQKVSKLTDKLTSSKEGYQALKTSTDALKQRILKHDAMLLKDEDLNEKLQATRDDYRSLINYKKYQDQLMTFEKDQQALKIIFQKANATYEHFEKNWQENQASQLALQLKDGQACPVCGSHHHPQKANNLHDETLSEAHRQKVTQAKDQAYQNLVKVEADIKSLTPLLDEAKAALEAGNLKADQLDAQIKYTLEKGKKIKEAYDASQKLKVDNQKDKQRLNHEEEQLRKIESEKNQLEKALNDANQHYVSLKTAYDTEIKVIPEHLRTIEALSESIEKLREKSQNMIKAWEAIQSQLEKNKNACRDLENTLHFQEKQIEALSQEHKKQTEIFYEKLSTIGINTLEGYQAKQLNDDEMASLKKAIEGYEEEIGRVQHLIADLKLALQSKAPVDLAALKTEVDEATQKADQAYQAYHHVDRLKVNLQEKRAVFIEQIQKAAKLEESLANIKHVYQVMRGDNPRKISFERFIQIDYLEMIIAAANQRFKVLSDGKFTLVRSENLEMRGKQSGLSIDVYDSHTGMTRDVKTLSGGEKFLASLCLALGLSDVIQSYQGGISIEMMFIDEGFGTLDEEALFKAIEALVQLKESGRYIGVISHVEALKNIFPAQLKVTKNQEGISQAKFIIK